MTGTVYSEVLLEMYPGTEWSIQNNDYSTLLWHLSTPKPTKKPLDGLWPETQRALARAEVERARHAAYIKEADPLFFYWQAGKGTKAAWEAKRAEIDARHPYA